MTILKQRLSTAKMLKLLYRTYFSDWLKTTQWDNEGVIL